MIDGSVGGSPAATRRFGRGQLYQVLSNPIYVGKVRHYEKVYEGEHRAIIDQEIFASVQALLVEQAPARRTNTNSTDLHLLTGILFDQDGNRLRSVHTKGAISAIGIMCPATGQRGRVRLRPADGGLPPRQSKRLSKQGSFSCLRIDTGFRSRWFQRVIYLGLSWGRQL